MSEALAGLRTGARVRRAHEPGREPRAGDLFELRYPGEPVQLPEVRNAVRAQVAAKGLRRLLDRGS